MIQPAGHKYGQFDDELLSSYASYYGKDLSLLKRILEHVEKSEHPEIALFQDPNSTPTFQSLCYVSSAWSRSYRRVRTSRDGFRVHRDFHYQIYFTAIDLLADVGCTSVRVSPLFNGEEWRWDALLCLSEALSNFKKAVTRNMTIQLRDDLIDQKLLDGLDESVRVFGFADHRPIAMCPYVLDGINMTRIFLSKQVAANSLDAS